ncbi:Copper radical oxidase [Rhodotorula toruloides ATCC 204091]|uniref:Copper radical oxidase n=1 Tax=Rhodotorula toruloides TaxID=5286 RepID=A0A0K3CJF1_RHOTO|nr:Copper radical oxidase [Rhodotorula toruloides ATCC 204091]KAK4333209.1 Copper radical oxidase [Rhodotorula toruloides]PRQ73351.1 copper radical oxidase [Rhodotorula toruloides]
MAPRSRTRTIASLAAALAAASTALAAPQDNTIEIVGESGVSAQQIFLAQNNKVYVVDKTERNPVNVTGAQGTHPAWATEYDNDSNTYRPMDIVTNSFCAGGNVLGNGTWINVGGNQAIGYGGLNANPLTGPYQDGDGGKATRRLDCSSGTCEWIDDGANYMTTRRWYPTLETLEDGTIIIVGGCDWGGYVNDAGQNNPTYEYYPSRGGPIGLNLLTTTLPANLFPLIWLLPSGNLFINANLGTEIFDYKNNVEYPLADIPHAVRTYPGSAATALMPLTPANNWTATIMFCGGTDLQPDQWTTNWNIAGYPADSTCVSMTPDVSTDWVDEEPLPEGRVMGNWIFLPDGRLVLINGIGKGTAGYGNTSWAIGQSFGDDPVHTVRYYDPNQPKGSRFSAAIANSTIDRMYHSSATLLPDGSVWSSGSNPNADYVPYNASGYKYFTEYRVERFYPDYYTANRPQPQGIPQTLTYGGDYFDIKLLASDVGKTDNLANTRVTLVRPGFSTHAMNMGQRFVELNMTYTVNSDGSAVLHTAQVPPNPAILPPGPVLIFVVVNGVPSQGQWVTVGNGQLGAQTVSAAAALPASQGGPAGKLPWNAGDLVLTQTTAAVTAPPTAAASSSSSKISSGKDTSGVAALRSDVAAVVGVVLAAIGTAAAWAL